MPDEIQISDEAIMEQAVAQLRRRFDTIQIFVTRQEHGGQESETTALHQGYGNWYARFGQIVEWIENVETGPRGE